MKQPPLHLPSTRCLVAFEAAARLGSFTAAATELHTSQSSVSRHIADLESRLGAPLFIRERQRVRLSEQGAHLFQSVRHGLDNIRSGMRVVADWTAPASVVIGCNHTVSHLVVMPHFDAVQTAMGDACRLRVMTYEYAFLDAELDPQLDIVFAHRPDDDDPADSALMMREAVKPVCSPAFAKAHGGILHGNLKLWAELPILDLSLPNRGWSTWDDWFASEGAVRPEAATIWFDSYVYLLEAAASGRGVALGMRGLIDRHLDSGALTSARGDYAEFGRAFYAVLTRQGRNRPIARQCMNELSRCALAGNQ